MSWTTPREYFEDPNELEWGRQPADVVAGKAAPKRESIKSCLRFINAAVQDARDYAANAVGAARAALLDPSVVRWGRQPQAVKDGKEPERTESLASSVSVINGVVQDIRDDVRERSVGKLVHALAQVLSDEVTTVLTPEQRKYLRDTQRAVGSARW